MVRQTVSERIADENETPRQVSVHTVNFRIHQIAETDHHTRKTDGYHEAVYELDIAEAVLLAVFVYIPPYSQEHAYRTAVGGQPPLPCHQYLPWMRKVVDRVIKEAMSQTRTHKCADEQGKEQRIKTFYRNTLPLVEGAHDIIAHREKPGHEKNAVPPQMESAYG